ncbi:hypothetical protein F0U60_31360 [Archangium minus]|uniref:Uncharacterized protein n=1 Tax=Archangium minus TaxID=83450 RepID=A0ABY9WYC9_9BACT|nr:hypothetical protein F0U60_31360 [Archangium minus]
MSSTIDLKKAVVRGPFWRAEVDVVQTGGGNGPYEFRQLFLDLAPRAVGGKAVLLPGTVIVLCHVRSVEVTPVAGTSYRWVRGIGQNAPTDPLTPAQLKQKILDGSLALLLAQTDPAQWTWPKSDKTGASTLGGAPAAAEEQKKGGRPSAGLELSSRKSLELVCLAGELSLDVLKPESNARTRLFHALKLEEAPLASRQVTGPARLTAVLSAHASGLSVFGRAVLPWEPQAAERFAAPFLLAKYLPDPRPAGLDAAVPGYRLALEEERLSPAERAALSSAWTRLSAALSPGNPTLGPTSTQGPAWVTLEASNPRAVPKLYWDIIPWREASTELPLHVGSGELSLLLSDSTPYDSRNPPTSLARALLSDALVRRTTQGVEVSVRVGPGAATKDLAYQAALADGAWREDFTLAQVKVAFSPVEVARAVRQDQQLPSPEWAPGDEANPVSPSVLWAFLRLEDGWAQLPVPNLTEQMYLDAELASFPERPPAVVLQGAVSYGNDRPDAPAAGHSEQPWSLALTDVKALSGTWTLARTSGPADAPLTLRGVTLAVTAPEVTVNGLVWLGTQAPSVEDALPGLDDWTGGLRSVPLRTVSPPVVFPPVVTLSIDRLKLARPSGAASVTPTLEAWSLSWGADAAVLARMVAAKLLPANLFSSHLALVWRRHASLPMVQALPLTQSRVPANHPSASRQLAPFELPVKRDSATGLELPDGWRFGVAGSNGASAWPSCQTPAVAAREWKTRADLPMAALSLPGLQLSPRSGVGGLPVDASLQLGTQLRFDLPYTDEVQALARIKEPVKDPAQVSPAADTPPPEPLKPLTRETLADHWQQLSTLATLAAGDAVNVFTTSGGTVQVPALIEPLPWTVTPTLDTRMYPGRLTVGDGVGALTLREESALEGFSGAFVERNGALQRLAPEATVPDGAYHVTAGSMAAQTGADGLRDQRGLWRGATSQQGTLLRTPVRLHESPTRLELVSTLEALSLDTGEDGSPWRFWFRDLPVAPDGFLRSRSRSAVAQDINDPDAGARERNHLNGYEWRLAPGASGTFSLFGLGFYPLTLETVAFDAGGVSRVDVVGRLQLPVPGAGELEDLGNAIRATFTRGLGGLALTGLALESAGPGAPAPEVEWPLALPGGEVGDAPRLVFTGLALGANGNRLEVSGVRLAFLLFGAPWSVPLPGLTFQRAVPEVKVRVVASSLDPKEPLSPKEVALQLQLATGEHALSVVLAVRLGQAIRSMPSGPRAQPILWRFASASDTGPEWAQGSDRSVFRADVRFHVHGGAGAGTAAWEAGHLFDDIPLDVPPSAELPLVASEGALQFTWHTAHPSAQGSNTASLQLLPGMHLSTGQGNEPRETPGFVALSYDVLSPRAGMADVPTLRLRTSFTETLLSSRWGSFLQEETSPARPTPEQVLASSAGDLVFGYTGQSRDASWVETLLLNGYLEVKNLISWPARLAYDAGKAQLTVPAIGTAPLHHVRHTARILFNQHLLPQGTVEVADGELLFQLATGKSWQFLAVVEHQLASVLPTQAFDAFSQESDLRWTALQEVRFTSPAVLKSFLLRFRDERLHVLDDEAEPDSAGDVLSGSLGKGVRALLAETPPAALDALAPGTLLVEASAAHWVKQEPVTGATQTSLQFLPGGIQQAILSNPQDYGPTDPADPKWLLLAMPFLGRLQDRTRDLTQVPLAGLGPVLQVDPVLNLAVHRARNARPPALALALTGFAEQAPVVLTFASLDTAVGHTWSRLDPLSLEESWFRVQHPPREEQPSGLQSVLAALPDSPARLSRGTALRSAFDPLRRAWPPATSTLPDGQPEPVPPPLPPEAPLQWREGALLVSQGLARSGSSSAAPPAGWVLTALGLASSGMLSPPPGLRRHVAATALPRAKQAANPLPMSLAVSPYLGLGFRPAPARQTLGLRLTVLELLCLDRATGTLLPAASYIWEGADAAQARAAALSWARENHRRLTPESPIAVVRFREVYAPRQTGSASESALVTAYAFSFVPDLDRPGGLTRRVLKLRSPPAHLRFREGHFGGHTLPEALRAPELAPPQVTGLQPLYLTARPASVSPAEPSQRWPWGYSALSATVQYTQGQDGVTGTVGDSPDGCVLWWQALQHHVQFRSASAADGPTAGLPALYRARAIKALLPVLPTPRLPRLNPRRLLNTADPQPLKRWQPVLPGAVRHTLVGARSGAMLAMRAQLVRQGLNPALDAEQAGTSMVSGSVPVQHRVPRPVPLPENNDDSPGEALRPWASRFEAARGVLATPSPSDEAYFTEEAGGEHRLKLSLVEPRHGAITATWAGDLVLASLTEPGGAFADWTVTLEVALDGQVFSFGAAEPLELGLYRFRLASGMEELTRRLSPGQVLSVQARIGRRVGMPGFTQTLSYPLRVVDPQARPLPLEPVFLHFEDPEYNRSLASTTKRASQIVKTKQGSEENLQRILRTVTLATDRGEYDPTARISLRHDWEDDDTSVLARLSFQRVGVGGVARPLTLRHNGEDVASVELAPKELFSLSLLDLREGSSPSGLAPGEALLLKLSIPRTGRVAEPTDVSLTVGISAEPVTPVPEAAYALLRRQQPPGANDEQVECARFAWAPEPARVELICPDDLRTEVVRRRAVFHWTDTVRVGTLRGYAVQKVTGSGSTHFPPVAELP